MVMLVTINPMLQAAPGSQRPLAGAQGWYEDAEERELREMALELLEMALDLAGIVDPTPLSDSASALLALTRGRWLDAAISGAGIIPYVGDLAKAGKLPRWLRVIDRALNASKRSRKIADKLRPALERIEQVLNWIPAGNNPLLMSIKQRVRGAVRPSRGKLRTKDLPDVRRQFTFHPPKMEGNFTRRVAEGRLGVPGRVKLHRNRRAQSNMNREFPGDDAGHFFGDRFGAPGGPENLGPQHWGVNQRNYRTMEDRWAKKLKKGYGIEAKVTDVTRAGETRPFKRRVEWTEIAPDGKRTHHERIFANPDSAKSRAARGETNPFPDDHVGDLIDMQDARTRLRGSP